MTMYPSHDKIVELLTDRLHMIAPGFTLDHYHHEPHHNRASVTVCAKEGLNRLMFRAKVFSDFVIVGNFDYIGTMPCKSLRGIDPRVQMLMDMYPDAHIQHVDDEGYCEEESIFGYVAYDDDLDVLAWAPIPIDDEGMAMLHAVPYITHTIPDGLEYPMQSIRENVESSRF